MSPSRPCASATAAAPAPRRHERPRPPAGEASCGFPRLRRRILHGLGRYAPWEPEFDFTPPPLGPGNETGPPDFVGIGVQKAGTTWWYELMLTHPGIFAPAGIHKERHFFDRFGARPMSAVGRRPATTGGSPARPAR